MNKIKVMSVFGTRPEAIKMAPLVKTLEELSEIFESKVLVTAQHREMLDQVLEIFEIQPDYDLDIMTHGQTLADVTSAVVNGVTGILNGYTPDILLVHGDTTTTFSASLAAFYQQVSVGHVEAGLRSFNKYSPFPEEINRQLTGRICEMHFAPTEGNRKNLIAENIAESQIHVTGNTVIDALMHVVQPDYVFQNQLLNELDFENKQVILLTAHRRENLGQPMREIFSAVREIALTVENVAVVYPMHLNPMVRKPALEILSGLENVHLIEPLEYVPFANLMAKSYLVMTDSGGIQEEAPALGKPVLVLRTETERPEAVKAGTVKVVGTDRKLIFESACELLGDSSGYHAMANAVNPYGDGEASVRIAKLIQNHFGTVK
jgi:UDP-N-acetylglucosamine 2-epimerase (non-hydrolysing)